MVILLVDVFFCGRRGVCFINWLGEVFVVSLWIFEEYNKLL